MFICDKYRTPYCMFLRQVRPTLFWLSCSERYLSTISLDKQNTISHFLLRFLHGFSFSVCSRAAVVRGKVVTPNGMGLIGVRVSTNGANEGFTMTRDDGWFDLMVNGGGPVMLQFGRNPYSPLRLALSVPWNEVVVLAPVRLRKEEVQVQVPGLYENIPPCPAHDYASLQPIALTSWHTNDRHVGGLLCCGPNTHIFARPLPLCLFVILIFFVSLLFSLSPLPPLSSSCSLSRFGSHFIIFSPSFSPSSVSDPRFLLSLPYSFLFIDFSPSFSQFLFIMVFLLSFLHSFFITIFIFSFLHSLFILFFLLYSFSLVMLFIMCSFYSHFFLPFLSLSFLTSSFLLSLSFLTSSFLFIFVFLFSLPPSFCHCLF